MKNRLRLARMVFTFALCAMGANVHGQGRNGEIKKADKLTGEAITHYRAREFAEAALLFGQALDIREQVLGVEHPDLVDYLVLLGATYLSSGEYNKALAPYERALQITGKSVGPEHPETALRLGDLAATFVSAGDPGKAVPLYERALEIHENSLGHSHKDTGTTLSVLAATYVDIGEYAKALPLYERALQIMEKSFGSRNPNTAAILKGLANTYNNIGDYTKALPLYERALKIDKKSKGQRDQDLTIAYCMVDLASVHANCGDYTEAVALIQSALPIVENELGPEHPQTAVIVNNLAATYAKKGEFRTALPLIERELAIKEKTIGSGHFETARTLSNLASLYSELGDDHKSLALHERALASRERQLGANHPDTCASYGSLSRVKYRMGDIDASGFYARKAINGQMAALSGILSLDEQSRLAWQGNRDFYWYACVLPPDEVAQILLGWKGVVISSLIEDRALALSAVNDTEGRAKLNEIARLRAKLAQIAFGEGMEDEVGRIREQIAKHQRSLSRHSDDYAVGGSRFGATLGEVLPSLTGNSVLLDFIRFKDPKLKGNEAVCYGAIITGADGSPSFVRIDGGASIDRAIDELRSAINQSQAKEVEAKTNFLSEKLWQPIAAKLPKETKRLFICPDANLNFLAFASLVDSDGGFVAEKYPIAYIGSGRDLARKASAEAARSLVVFADPIFDASDRASSAKHMVAMRSAEADVFGAINLPPLPGTKAEADQLEIIAAGAGWDIKKSTGAEATESGVREAKKPGVLHLATHGFYLNSFSPPAEDGTRGMSVVGLSNEDKKQNENGVDPMRASGIALTGAQQTLKSWSQRKAPDPETDGILTAEEVASLDLDGTWLVTLSACETGVGEARSGEGVFGLRRAFMIAGAENLLMTLWPVADDTTASIMADFYKEALATGDAPGSLAKVQRDWLVKLREEKGLATAIREAGPFAMVMMTAPSHPPVELPPIAKAELASKPATALSEQPPSDAPASEKKSSWWPF